MNEVSRISKIASSIAPSMIRRLFNLAKTMDDVVDFTLGDPDVQPHVNIKESACRAIMTGKTRYSQNAGLIELRECIGNRYQANEGLSYDPATEIAVTVGAMEGLYLTLLSLINPGDEVIIPAPFYVNYKQMVEMCHGVPVIVSPSNKTSLSVSANDIENAVSTKTKAIIINSPSNPTGKIFSAETLNQIAGIVKKRNLVVITDEVYKKLVYDNIECFNIASIDGMKNHTVIVNSLSKEFCMTGYRIGYILGPEDIVSTVVKLQENVAACAPLPSQYAAIEAIGSNEDYSAEMVTTFTSRRNVLCKTLENVPGLNVIVPEATFYAMVDIRGLGYQSSEKFAYDLLNSAKVAVVPGIAYGDICEGYVRIAFTLSEDRITEGTKRIAKFVESLNK